MRLGGQVTCGDTTRTAIFARPERLLAGCARSSLARARDRPRGSRACVQLGSGTRQVVELPRRLRRRSGVRTRLTARSYSGLVPVLDLARPERFELPTLRFEGRSGRNQPEVAAHQVADFQRFRPFCVWLVPVGSAESGSTVVASSCSTADESKEVTVRSAPQRVERDSLR